MHTGIKGRQGHTLIRFLLRSRVDEKSADLHKAVHLCFTFTFTFTFSHLADAFIQSDLQLGST